MKVYKLYQGNEELASWDVAPALLALPNGDMVMGAEPGWESGDFRYVLEEVAESKAMLLATAKQRRWEIEQGGFVVGGMTILTDDRSKLMLMGAKALAEADPDYVADWAMPDGSTVKLTAEQIKAIALAVAKFVDECFTVFAGVGKQIESGELTTSADVIAAFPQP